MKSIISLMTIALSFVGAVHASEALSPPSINEATRGTPAQLNSIPKNQGRSTDTENAENNELAGEQALETKHTGAKGYVHGLEIGHSQNNVQYIEDSDRDGQIQKKSSELDEVTELPKWKLGSW